MGTSNTNNTGVVHASQYGDGREPLCRRRAFVTLAIASFVKVEEKSQCKRCLAKLANKPKKWLHNRGLNCEGRAV